VNVVSRTLLSGRERRRTSAGISGRSAKPPAIGVENSREHAGLGPPARDPAGPEPVDQHPMAVIRRCRLVDPFDLDGIKCPRLIRVAKRRFLTPTHLEAVAVARAEPTETSLTLRLSRTVHSVEPLADRRKHRHSGRVA
jgi:hypothetical protein